jgi:hypothetical protein
LWTLLVAVFSVLLAFFFGPWAKESLKSVPHPYESPRPYHVVDIPEKGKGVIATRDITRGELLYRESPLFIVPGQSGCSSVLIDVAEVNPGVVFVTLQFPFHPLS